MWILLLLKIKQNKIKTKKTRKLCEMKAIAKEN